MKRNLLLLFSLFLFSCGGGSSPTQPPSMHYYTADQTFIDELVNLNVYLSADEITAGITTTDFIDTTGSKYYKIKELNLSEMTLDSIPNSITELDSLISLNLRDNQIENLDPNICELTERGVLIDVGLNLLCNSQVPTCILNIESTVPAFFSTQKECNHNIGPEDLEFIDAMVRLNWGKTANDPEYDSLWSVLNNEQNTIWQEFIEHDEVDEEDKVFSRIIKINYQGFNEQGGGIHTIPSSIIKLDSLKFVYLTNNNLVTIPAEFGDLERLEKLYLDQNHITEIPETIGDGEGLRKLKELVLNDNELTSIKTSLGNLTSLTELDLSRNNLETLPASLCDLVNVIKIRYNKFCPACTEECENCNSIYNSCFNDLIIVQTPDNAQNCDPCDE